MAMLKDKRKDFVLDSLSLIDASVGAISMDVQAFKNIRNYLFMQITDEIQTCKNGGESKDEIKGNNNIKEDSQ